MRICHGFCLSSYLLGTLFFKYGRRDMMTIHPIENGNHHQCQFATHKVILVRYRTEDKNRWEKGFRWDEIEGQLIERFTDIKRTGRDVKADLCS